MKRSSILLLLAIVGLLLSGCVNQADVQSVPVADSNQNVLVTYEIADEQHPDDFARWQAENEKRIVQDRWDAAVDTVNHELTADIDVSEDFVECDKSIDVTVEVENKGDETENVRVTLAQDKLGAHGEKFVEVEPGHVQQVTFDVGTVAPEGRYTFEAQVFRDITFDRDNNVRDGGEFEDSASKTIFIATCRE